MSELEEENKVLYKIINLFLRDDDIANLMYMLSKHGKIAAKIEKNYVESRG